MNLVVHDATKVVESRSYLLVHTGTCPPSTMHFVDCFFFALTSRILTSTIQIWRFVHVRTVLIEEADQRKLVSFFGDCRKTSSLLLKMRF